MRINGTDNAARHDEYCSISPWWMADFQMYLRGPFYRVCPSLASPRENTKRAVSVSARISLEEALCA